MKIQINTKQSRKINGRYYPRVRTQQLSESNALTAIIEGVLEDVANRSLPISELQDNLATAPQLRDAYKVLSSKDMSLIAEVKRSSPSKGDLANISDPISLAKSYEIGGADIVSVLTESRKFKGSITDLTSVRQSINLPVLRKDFIVTEYQIFESRLLGSDLLLLIVAGLNKKQLIDYHQLATELGMSVLIEVHTVAESEIALDIGAKIIGVNCRNLKTLEIDKNAFELILPILPQSIVKVAESGISARSDVERVAQLGANAVLVGETLVKSSNPVHTIKDLLNQ